MPVLIIFRSVICSRWLFLFTHFRLWKLGKKKHAGGCYSIVFLFEIEHTYVYVYNYVHVQYTLYSYAMGYFHMENSIQIEYEESGRNIKKYIVINDGEVTLLLFFIYPYFCRVRANAAIKWRVF